jgi:UDP-GlcNAc:undecaprenyl-phosphate GlcNAc-1-phosphate transferase
MQTLFGFFLAMSITMLLMPLLIRSAGPLRIMDIPEARKVHAAPVPRVGGIAMVAGIVTALLVWDAGSRQIQALLLCIGVLLVFGVWDDRKNLSSGPKFAGQLIAVAVAIIWGGVSIATMTGSERMALPEWVAVPLTVLFLLGGTNAFNLADGLDGLAGGMAMLCLSGTALLAFTVGKPAIGGVALIMIGALVGFLRFNTHPARVFMGDGGSQVLGFSAAMLTVLLTQDPQIPLSSALPLLLLGMPIIDTLMVLVERVLAHKSPFKADRRHIHHRLLALGFHHWEAVSILYLLQAGLFVAAWWLRYAPDVTVALVFVAFATLVLAPIRFAEWRQLRVRHVAPGAWTQDQMISVRGSLKAPRQLACGGVAVALAVFAAWVLLRGAQPSRDLQLLAVILGLALSISLLLRRGKGDAGWLEKMALYSSAALAVFLLKQSSAASPIPPLFECILFAALIVAVVVCIRTSKEGPFRITPLDILVVVIVVTVPNLPDSIASTRSLGAAVAELVILFYALETLSVAARLRWRWLSGAAAVFLFALVVRAVV